MINLNVIHCLRDRAHLTGAQAVILEKQGDHFRARDARRRYFRQLAAIDILMGNSPSPFENLD